MSEKRFVVESVKIIDDCNEDKSRIAKVITDKEELYSYDDLYEICDLLNEQQAIIEALKEKLCEFGVSDVKINGKRINTGLEEWLDE